MKQVACYSKIVPVRNIWDRYSDGENPFFVRNISPQNTRCCHNL